MLKNIFWAGWYKKKNEKVKTKLIVKIMETYISCLVSSYIYNIVRIYNQVLMASTKFNSKKEIIVYMMHKMLNEMLDTQRRIQNPVKHLRQSVLRQ